MWVKRRQTHFRAQLSARGQPESTDAHSSGDSEPLLHPFGSHPLLGLGVDELRWLAPGAAWGCPTLGRGSGRTHTVKVKASGNCQNQMDSTQSTWGGGLHLYPARHCAASSKLIMQARRRNSHFYRWWFYLTQSGASKPVAAKAEHSAAKAGVNPRKFVRMPSPLCDPAPLNNRVTNSHPVSVHLRSSFLRSSFCAASRWPV